MKNKKKVFIFLIFIIAFLNQLYNLSFTDYNSYPFNNMSVLSYKENESIFYKNQHLIQTIVAQDNNFNGIKIYLDPVERYYSEREVITTGIEVSLYDESNKLIDKYKFQSLFVSESQTIDFTFPKIKDSKGKKYYLHIESYHEAPFYIRLGLNTKKSGDYKLTIDGKKSDYSLFFQTFYESSVRKHNGGIFISSVIILLLLLLYIFFINNKNIPIHKKYLMAAIVFSMLVLLFTPFFKGSDEGAHWARIIDISNGKFITETIDGWPQSRIPNRITQIEFDAYHLFPNMLFSDQKGSSYVDMQCMAVYPPSSYLPQTIGVLIGKCFTKNAVVWAYLAKIFQALTCIVLIYFAIKIIPFGKDVLAFIALIPTSLRAMALLSADGILLASVLLFVAKILQLIYDKKDIVKKDYVILTILSIFISTSKVVYYPLCFILFLIPLLKKKDKKKLVKNVILILVFALIITIMWNIVAMSKLIDGQGINTVYLIKYFLHHPLKLICIIIYSFIRQTGNFISDVFGGNNNWYGLVIDDGTIFPIIYLVIYVFLIIKGENKLKEKPKILLALILIVTYILISISLLLVCTPISKNEIYGIQGRYFIPFLLPIYLIFANNKKKMLEFDVINCLIFVFLFYFLNFIMIWV